MSEPVRSAPPDPIEAIARAVLYEGYLLWPYRRSARKNQTRFTFGALYPRGFCETAREGDASSLRCECLVEGSGEAELAIELRCLQLVHRQVMRGAAEDREPVDRLEAAGALHLTWDEARERRCGVVGATLAELERRPRRSELCFAPGFEQESLGDGGALGALDRSWKALEALVTVDAERVTGCEPAAGAATPDACARDLWRIVITVANGDDWSGTDRLEAQRHSLLSAHLVLHVAGADCGRRAFERRADFVSLTDPPSHAAAAARACRNTGVWPVLVGEPGDRSTLLASPIVLEDHPRTAPETDGDLFDGAEIVELLGLNILALTDDEKVEMAATDPAARAILERTEALGRGSLDRLHGALRPAGGGGV